MPPAYAHTCVFTPLQADNSSNCTNHSRPHQPKNFIFNTELAWALHCLFTPIPPFYSHKAAGSISSWVGSPCREQGSPSDASDRHWLHPASPSVAHHASSLQALLSCLHTNHSSSTKKGLHFPSKAPGKKKKKKDAMPWLPAEQESKEYSRNPGNTYGEFSSNEDRALQVQLCSEVVLPKPENKLCITHIISKEGNTTTASPRIWDLS